jgi:hypothetical protein
MQLGFILLFIIKLSLKNFFSGFLSLLNAHIYLGKDPARLSRGSIVFFPYRANTLNCGLTGIVALKLKDTSQEPIHINMLDQMVEKTSSGLFDLCRQNSLPLPEYYFGGEDHMAKFLALVRSWKIFSAFYQIYNSAQIQKKYRFCCFTFIRND